MPFDCDLVLFVLQLSQRAREIYNSFLSSKATTPVNIDSQAQLADDILNAPRPDMFKEQQLQVRQETLSQDVYWNLRDTTLSGRLLTELENVPLYLRRVDIRTILKILKLLTYFPDQLIRNNWLVNYILVVNCFLIIQQTRVSYSLILLLKILLSYCTFTHTLQYAFIS